MIQCALRAKQRPLDSMSSLLAHSGDKQYAKLQLVIMIIMTVLYYTILYYTILYNNWPIESVLRPINSAHIAAAGTPCTDANAINM